MQKHCFETINDNLFVIDQNLDTFVYEFNNWTKVNQSFPCQSQYPNELICKAFGSDWIIVPSVENGTACTGIFNVTEMEWKRLKVDQRNAPYNGRLINCIY